MFPKNRWWVILNSNCNFHTKTWFCRVIYIRRQKKLYKGDGPIDNSFTSVGNFQRTPQRGYKNPAKPVKKALQVLVMHSYALRDLQQLGGRFTDRSPLEDQMGNWVKYHRCDRGKKCYLERSGTEELRRGSGIWVKLAKWVAWNPRRGRRESFCQGKGHGQRYDDRDDHVQWRVGANNQNLRRSGGGGGSDKKLRPSYKGSRRSVGLRDYWSWSYRVTVQIICINLVLVRSRYLSTVTMHIISFLGFGKLF